MKPRDLLQIFLLVTHSYASESVFSVNDDVLAFPQYQLVFSDTYITEERANLKLNGVKPSQDAAPAGDVGEVGKLLTQPEARVSEDAAEKQESYERMMLKGKPYLCAIPHVDRSQENKTEEKPPKDVTEHELARAAHRGWELLQDMEGKPCLFFSTGWWSYSFCYNNQVKQFHSLPPGTNGAPLWPPTEDPTTPSYILGRVEESTSDKDASADPGPEKHELNELQTKAETSYLVQRLASGTPCDLTGKPRKIEVQFHCNPQSTDRIGWIKETSTCSYLMIVYTPRLCNDVAFLPPKESRAHTISCRQILTQSEIPDWVARKADEARHRMIEPGTTPQIIVGNVVVGAMKDVGKDGQKIERGKVVLTPEEKADIVVIQKDGQVQGLSKAALRKLDLNPEDVDAFRKELEKLAGKKDWKIERIDDPDGNIQLRGVVATGSDSKLDETKVEKLEKELKEPSEEDEEGEKAAAEGEGEEEEVEHGSEEEYKPEV